MWGTGRGIRGGVRIGLKRGMLVLPDPNLPPTPEKHANQPTLSTSDLPSKTPLTPPKKTQSTLSAPQMLVVTELDEPFLPLPDDLLVNLRDSREVGFGGGVDLPG